MSKKYSSVVAFCAAMLLSFVSASAVMAQDMPETEGTPEVVINPETEQTPEIRVAEAPEEKQGAADQYQAPEGTPVRINGKPYVQGNQMVNECGYPLQLRGMSSYGLAWSPNFQTEENIKHLRDDWGIDIYRLAMYTAEWGGYTTEQFKTIDDYREWIDELVDICGRLGVYCLIDWHILKDNNPNTHREEAVEFFDYMSKKHAGKKHVLYEICNEPNGSSVTWAKVKYYAEEVVAAIRANDPESIIIIGSPTWSQDVHLAADDPVEGTNLMYTLHFYAGTHFGWLRDRAEAAMDKGIAIFVTEFGVSKADGNGGVYKDSCDVWFDWMDKHNISWCNWSLTDKNESSAALKAGKGDINQLSTSGEYIRDRCRRPDKFISCVDAVNDIEANEVSLSVYPNPAMNEISIDLGEISADDVERIAIADMSGREVLSSIETENINISSLRDGVYVVRVYTSSSVVNAKLVKKN